MAIVSSFDANRVHPYLHVPACNLGNFLRRLTMPPSAANWTLTAPRGNPMEIAGKAARHARYATFRLADMAIPQRPYPAILDRIRGSAATRPQAAPR